MMFKTTTLLAQHSRAFVASVAIPAFLTPPPVLLWGQRFFLLEAATGDYIETFCYVIPPPLEGAVQDAAELTTTSPAPAG